MCVGHSAVIRLIAFPLDQQIAMVAGEKKVKTVDHNESGQLVEVEVALKDMTQRDLAVAFNGTGFRPIKEQRVIAAKWPKDVRRSSPGTRAAAR